MPTSNTPATAETPAITPVEAVPVLATVPFEEEYDIELSEDSPLSEAELNEIAEEAGKNNLSKDQAQALVAAREKFVKSGMTKEQESHRTKIETARKELLADPDFQEANLPKTMEAIGRVVRKFGDVSIVKALNSAEFGNNLALGKFLKRIGDAMGSESEVPGKSNQIAPASTEDTIERRLYPSMFEKN